MAVQFLELKAEDVAWALAPEEIPESVDPLDPDGEIRYFNYDDWRDMDDACRNEPPVEEEDIMTDYWNMKVDQVGQG